MKKYENFCAALRNLHDIYDFEEPYSNVILTGLTGLFQICFEQSWKAMKECLEQAGFPEGDTGSPRMILKTAYQAGMILDETLWLSALSTRNDVAHAYKKEIALKIVSDTKERFYPMFEALKTELEARWI